MLKKYLVPEHIIKMAVGCVYNTSCLTTGCCGDRSMCLPIAPGNELLFIESKKQDLCVNKRSFAYSINVCICPVRLFIFNEYNE